MLDQKNTERIELSVRAEKLRIQSRLLYKSLKKLQQSENINRNCLRWRLHKTIAYAQQVAHLSDEISQLQVFGLSKEEYVFFCDFIVCGSEMAEYLAEHKIVKKTMRNHARYWLSLVKKFKPFLQNSLKQTK